MNRVLQVLLTGNATQLKGVLASSAASVDAFEKKVTGANAKVESSTNRGLVAVKALAIGAGALAAGYGLAVGKAMQFETAMSGAASATGVAGKELETLRAAAMKAGADSQYSANEAANAITEMGKAGVSTTDILGGGLKGSLALAAAGQIDVAEAAELSSIAMTQFNLEGRDLPRVADLLAAGAGKAMGSVGDLGAALNQSGLLASAAGLSIEETTGTLAAFASAGLVGSDAGTSLKTMLQMLQSPSKEAAEQMNQLGLDVYDADGNMRGMDEIAGELQSSMSGLTQEQRNAALATIFGSDAVRAANVLYKEGEEGIAGWTKAVDDQGYAAKTAAELTDNLSGDLERLGGAFDTLLINIGSTGQGPLRLLVQGLEKGLEGADALVTSFQGLEPVGSLIDDVGDVAGNLWDILVDLATAVAPVVGGLAAVGGAVVVGGLTVLATALESVTGFLAENEELALGLATILTVQMMGGIAGVQTMLWRLVGTPVVLFFANLAGAAGTAAGVMSGGLVAAAGAARTAIMGLITAAAPLAALFVLGAAIQNMISFARAGDDARESIKQVNSQLDEMTNAGRVTAVEQAIKDARAEMDEYRKIVEEYNNQNWFDRNLWYVPFGGEKSEVEDARQSIEAYDRQLRELEQTQTRHAENVQWLAQHYGTTTAKVIEFADAQGIDLSQATSAATGEFIKMVAITGEFKDEVGLLPGAVDQASGGLAFLGDTTGWTIEQIEASIEAIEAWLEEMQKVASGFIDPLSIYKTQLQEKTDAERAQAEAAAAATEDASDSWEDHAEAVTVSLDELATELLKQVENQENWRQNVVDVTERGGLEVGQILHDMGVEGADITAAMATATEEDFAKMKDALIRESRLAGEGSTRELGIALRAAEIVAREGGKATAEAVAKELGIGVEEVARIAGDYGIKLAEGINPVLTGVGKPAVNVRSMRQAAGRGMQALAEGGPVQGPYVGPKADNVIIRANPREFMQPVAAVDHYGVGFMEAIRTRRFPKDIAGYAEGGLVGFGRRLQGMGARVAGHPAFGGVTMGAHGKTSLHYSGQAIDVNTRGGTSALEQQELTPMAALARSLGFRTIFMSPGHFNHLHVDTGGAARSIGSIQAALMPTLPPVPTFPYAGIVGSGPEVATAAREVAQKFLDDQAALAMVSGPGGVSGGSATGLLPIMAAARQYVMGTYGVNNIGGYANRNIAGTSVRSDHALGKAIDVMTTNVPLGWRIANDLAHGEARRRFNIENVIWQQSISSRGGPFRRMADRGSPTQNHLDHVHADTYDQGGLAYGTGALLKETIKPERVLNPRQTQAFENWMVSPAAQRGYGANPGGAGGFGVSSAPVTIHSPITFTGPVYGEDAMRQIVRTAVSERDSALKRNVRSARR